MLNHGIARMSLARASAGWLRTLGVLALHRLGIRRVLARDVDHVAADLFTDFREIRGGVIRHLTSRFRQRQRLWHSVAVPTSWQPHTGL